MHRYDSRRRRHVGTRTRVLVAPMCVPQRAATPRVVSAISTLSYIRDTPPIMQIISKRLRIQSITTINQDIFIQARSRMIYTNDILMLYE